MPRNSLTDLATGEPAIYDSAADVCVTWCCLSREYRVRPTFRTELRGGSCAEADAARRSPPLRLTRCGRRAAVTLGGLLSRLGRRASVSPPRQLLCGVGRRCAIEADVQYFLQYSPPLTLKPSEKPHHRSKQRLRLLIRFEHCHGQPSLRSRRLLMQCDGKSDFVRQTYATSPGL